MSYVHCLIGFDMDYDKFMSSVTVMLADIPAKIYKRLIQVPHITTLGWLFGMHEDLSLPSLESLLQDTTKLLAPNQSPPIQFGLTYKPIYDGTLRKERDKNHSQGKWVVHVEAITEIALTSKAYLKKALLSSVVKAYTNLPLLLVPILQKKTASSKWEDIKRAIAHHATVLHLISKSFSSKILSLNWPLMVLQNATLHTTLMAVTMTDGKKLFLSVDPTWNGQGFNISYPTHYASQAHNFVEYLPAYLTHSHSNEVYHWFTPDAVTEAQTMGWDDQKTTNLPGQHGLLQHITIFEP